MSSKRIVRCVVLILLSASSCFAWSFYRRDRPSSTDCVVGKWRPWSPCLLDFTDPFLFTVMTRTRFRPVVQWPRGNGKVCPPIQEIEECEASTPLDCEVGQWSHWSYCSPETSTPGSRTIQERYREVIVEAKNNGKACPGLSEIKDCVMDTKDRDCQVSKWSEFSDCFALDVGTGEDIMVKERARVIEVDRQGQGEECPVLAETEICEEEEESPTPSPKKQGCKKGSGSGCGSSKSGSSKGSSSPKKSSKSGSSKSGSSSSGKKGQSGSSKSGSPKSGKRGGSSSSGNKGHGSSKGSSQSGSPKSVPKIGNQGGSSSSSGSSSGGNNGGHYNYYRRYYYRRRNSGSSKK